MLCPARRTLLSNVLPSVIKNDSKRHAAGASSYLTRDLPRDGKGFDNLPLEDQARWSSSPQGWSTGPQTEASPKEEREKDVFFSALAQKSDSLSEKEKKQ